MGYYYADREVFEEISKATGTGNRRHPLTYILEAADDLAYKTADIEDAFAKGFVSYHALEKELSVLQGRGADGRFDAAGKLHELYEREEKSSPIIEILCGENWIVRVQGFLISCATYGFTSHYEEIMEGSFCQDLFYGTWEKN